MAIKRWLAGWAFMGLLGTVGIATFGFGVWVLFFYMEKLEAHPAIEVGRAALTLGTGIILGGAVKTMLDRHQDRVADKKKAHELTERLLADLRDVHDRAEAARLVHADIYRQHVDELIRCQVVLLKVKRTLDLRAAEVFETTRSKRKDRARDYLAEMIGYLRVLEEELASKDAHPPLLDDLAAKSPAIYTERFKKPLYKLSGQLLGDDKAELDEGPFDTRVEQVVGQLKELPSKKSVSNLAPP